MSTNPVSTEKPFESALLVCVVIMALSAACGTLKTGRFFDLTASRTSINSFYNTLLHATGDLRDRFNMSDSTAETHDPRKGSLEVPMA